MCTCRAAAVMYQGHEHNRLYRITRCLHWEAAHQVYVPWLVLLIRFEGIEPGERSVKAAICEQGLRERGNTDAMYSAFPVKQCISQEREELATLGSNLKRDNGFPECHPHGRYSSCYSNASLARMEMLSSIPPWLFCIYIYSKITSEVKASAAYWGLQIDLMSQRDSRLPATHSALPSRPRYRGFPFCVK